MSRALSRFINETRKTSGTSTTTLPVLIGGAGGPGVRDGCERIASGRPCGLVIMRSRDGATGALDGTVAIWATNLRHQNATTNVQRFRGFDGATGKTVFTSGLTFAAFSNFNWVVLANGVVLDQGAGAGKFQISNAGGFAVVTLGTAAADDDILELHFVTPATLKADGANEQVNEEIVGKSLVWGVLTHASNNASATQAWLEPLT